MNFGGFATPGRALVFDINDFDETFPGPWEWDVKRLAASLILAARDRSFSKAIAGDAVRAAVTTYRQRMADFAEMKVLDMWYAQVNIEAILKRFRKDPDFLGRLLKKRKQAHSQTSETVAPKLTAVVNGRRKIKDNPPFLFHFQQNVRDFEQVNRNHIEQYQKSLQADRLALFERYKFQDSAVKVVGVAALGRGATSICFWRDKRTHCFFNPKKRAGRCWNRHAARAALSIRVSVLWQASG